MSEGLGKRVFMPVSIILLSGAIAFLCGYHIVGSTRLYGHFTRELAFMEEDSGYKMPDREEFRKLCKRTHFNVGQRIIIGTIQAGLAFSVIVCAAVMLDSSGRRQERNKKVEESNPNH